MNQEYPDQEDTSTKKTLLVGLSGPSSSGKTTLARILRTIFNVPASESTDKTHLKLFILHEDDFYKTDTLIPRKTFTSSEHGTRELEDWDCVESLDLPLLKSTLCHVKQHGGLPKDMISKEDQNAIGESGVSDSEIQKYKTDIESWFTNLASGTQVLSELTLVIIDGFLLYPSPSSKNPLCRQLNDILQSLLSLKLFLPSTRSKTIDRRARRTGYVTLEGFWADPPGYVEDVVWPNYVADHEWLFHAHGLRGSENAQHDTQKNVDEGRVNREAAVQAGLFVGPGTGDRAMSEILQWGTEQVKDLVQREIQLASKDQKH